MVPLGDIVNLCLLQMPARPYTPPNSCIKYRSLDVCIIEYRSLKVFPNLGSCLLLWSTWHWGRWWWWWQGGGWCWKWRMHKIQITRLLKAWGRSTWYIYWIAGWREQTSSQAPSYASPKLSLTDSLTDSLTGVKCRATSVAKNYFFSSLLLLRVRSGPVRFSQIEGKIITNLGWIWHFFHRFMHFYVKFCCARR